MPVVLHTPTACMSHAYITHVCAAPVNAGAAVRIPRRWKLPRQSVKRWYQQHGGLAHEQLSSNGNKSSPDPSFSVPPFLSPCLFTLTLGTVDRGEGSDSSSSILGLGEQERKQWGAVGILVGDEGSTSSRSESLPS
ncbi:hypothetical protein PG995_007885 [Apiospora arundinis]